MDLSYLTTPQSSMGTLEWIFLVAQLAVAFAGIYLAFLRADTHSVRGPLVRRLGYVLLVIGAIGAALIGLRLAAISAFQMPFWITIITVLEVVVAVYALYYASSVYPAQAAAATANRSRQSSRQGSRPQAPRIQVVEPGDESDTNGVTRPISTGGRRESRRDRKRRNR